MLGNELFVVGENTHPAVNIAEGRESTLQTPTRELGRGCVGIHCMIQLFSLLEVFLNKKSGKVIMVILFTKYTQYLTRKSTWFCHRICDMIHVTECIDRPYIFIVINCEWSL